MKTNIAALVIFVGLVSARSTANAGKRIKRGSRYEGRSSGNGIICGGGLICSSTGGSNDANHVSSSSGSGLRSKGNYRDTRKVKKTKTSYGSPRIIPGKRSKDDYRVSRKVKNTKAESRSSRTNSVVKYKYGGLRAPKDISTEARSNDRRDVIISGGGTHGGFIGSWNEMNPEINIESVEDHSPEITFDNVVKINRDVSYDNKINRDISYDSVASPSENQFRSVRLRRPRPSENLIRVIRRPEAEKDEAYIIEQKEKMDFKSGSANANMIKAGISSDGFGSDEGFGSGGRGLSFGGCANGEARAFDGSCVKAKVTRNLFLYTAPKHQIETLKPKDIPSPKVHVNYVFVRTQDNISSRKPVVVPPPKQKTLVYVLSRRPTAAEQEVIEVPSTPIAPELFFVQYNEGEDAELPGGVSLQEALSASVQEGQTFNSNDGGSSGESSSGGRSMADNSFSSGGGFRSGGGSSSSSSNRNVGIGNIEYLPPRNR